MSVKMTLFAAVALAAALLRGGAVSLDGEWELCYFPQPEDGAIRSLPLKVKYETVKATVPGNCELDLVRAGILPDPEKGMNGLAAFAWEKCQWLYTRRFTAPALAPCERAVLVFDGIDTLADVFLNGKKVGEASSMVIPHRFDVTQYLKQNDENTVQVLLRSLAVAKEKRNDGYWLARKAVHMGGWDILPRLFVSGLWRSVRLEVVPPVRIEEAQWITRAVDPDARRARLRVRALAGGRYPLIFDGGAKMRFTLSRNGRPASRREVPLETWRCEIDGWEIEDADLWWPRSFGAPALYDAAVEVVAKDGAILASRRERIGLRTIDLEYEDIDLAKEGHRGQFLFTVNGRPCYIRGTNWVPVDALHGRDMERIGRTMEMLVDLNCNMVRMWGGGVYEPDRFFDFCDENGILVWQDFIDASTGNDPAYADVIRHEVESVVKRLRNHASLALWCGNNELDLAQWAWPKDQAKKRDPNENDRTSRELIPEAIFRNDEMRRYLPSSPYLSPAVVAGRARAPERHNWDRAYYKRAGYIRPNARFNSEVGFHGCPNRESLARMMSPGGVYPWKSDDLADWNDEWRLKGVCATMDRTKGTWKRNDTLVNQVKNVFDSVSRDLDDFIFQSQFVQGESLKTITEAFRMDKFEKYNGMLWWNLRDGWPVVSDAIVDYYFGKKRAYDVMKLVQQDQLVAVDDGHRVVAVNDTLRPVRGAVKITDVASGRTLLATKYEVPANGTAKIGEVPFNGQGMLLIDYEQGGMKLKNYFLYGKPPFRLSDVKAWLSAFGSEGCETALFGVNYYAPFSVDYDGLKARGLDVPSEMRRDIAHLRRLGLDYLRLHCFDRQMSAADGHLIENDHLAMLDELIAICASNGMKVALTPMCMQGGTYARETGFAGRFKWGTYASDPDAVACQTRFLEDFGNHVNPRTGLRYADDPAIVAFELVNEPHYPEGFTDAQVTAYANTLADALRRTGTKKPLFYNAFFLAQRIKAVAAARVDGVSGASYPVGLSAGHAIAYSRLGMIHPNDCWRDPVLDGKARMIYEFDAADVPGSYAYPAMARAFRCQGAQLAAQFQYDPAALADVNANWRTHHLNLLHTPGKALSLAIAAEAFRRIPRFSEPFGPDWHSHSFGPFRVDADRDLSEMSTATDFLYSNDTDTHPPAPEKLHRVWGVGQSPVVMSSGTGAYFLDRVAPGEWTLEVFPDVARLADPHTGSHEKKTELLESDVDLAIDLPDLGGPRCVRVRPGRHVLRRSDPVRTWKIVRRSDDRWRPAKRLPPADGSVKMGEWNFLGMDEAMAGRSKKAWMMDFSKSVETDADGRKCFRMVVKKFGDRGRFVRLGFDVDGRSTRNVWPDAGEPAAIVVRVRAAHPDTTKFRLRLGDDLGVARETVVPLTGEWRDVTIPLARFTIPAWSRRPPPEDPAFRLKRWMSFTFEFGRDLFPETYGRPHGIEIASLRLLPDTHSNMETER